MYQQLFTRLALTGNGTSEVSQPVAMQGANAVQYDIVVISLSGTGTPTVTCQLQESNDLENWKDKGSTTAPTAVGYTLSAAQTGLASGYVVSVRRPRPPTVDLAREIAMLTACAGSMLDRGRRAATGWQLGTQTLWRHRRRAA